MTLSFRITPLEEYGMLRVIDDLQDGPGANDTNIWLYGPFPEAETDLFIGELQLMGLIRDTGHTSMGVSYILSKTGHARMLHLAREVRQIRADYRIKWWHEVMCYFGFHSWIGKDECLWCECDDAF